MTATTSNRRSLFIASCASLLVTSLSFGIRAGILGDLGCEFGLDNGQLGNITATAFWGFPISMIIGGIIVDKVGMKPLMRIAYLGHFAGILLTIFAQGYWTLWISTLSIGLANGMVEAVCNPLVASIYPEEKTAKLNLFHLWFPGGIVIGSLVVYGFDVFQYGDQWQLMMAIMLIPTIWYAIQMERLTFPKTERVQQKVSTSEMYKELLNPLFIIITIAMLGTATSELFVNQWTPVLLKSVTENAIVILLITSGVMTIGRGFAGPIVKRLSTTGMLLFSAVFTSLGLYLLGSLDGNYLFLAAIVFGIGVTFFWPTMVGFVATYIPKSGAVGMAVIGAAGMFATALYTIYQSEDYEALKKALDPREEYRLTAAEEPSNHTVYNNFMGTKNDCPCTKEDSSFTSGSILVNKTTAPFAESYSISLLDDSANSLPKEITKDLDRSILFSEFDAMEYSNDNKFLAEVPVPGSYTITLFDSIQKPLSVQTLSVENIDQDCNNIVDAIELELNRNVILQTLKIPLVLILIFFGIHLYVRRKKHSWKEGNT